jgi:ABC-type bacteriocin/lantibiotic exporter with double-glycine peptidase domain
VARWLETEEAGTPSNRVLRLAQRSFEVTYITDGSLADLEAWLEQQTPLILFVRTGDLSYWSIDTAHAVVLAGLSGDQAHLFDPAVEMAPLTVSTEELLLAWSHFEYTYAAIEL